MSGKNIAKGDFVEIEYVGRIKDSGKIFDLTDSELAKEKGIYQSDARYGPVIICVGYRDVVSGLDDEFIGKEAGTEFDVEVGPEKGFGKKRAELIKLVPLSVFSEKGVRPVPGVQFSFDGVIGIVRSVSGGRILVDFNHPLSGRILFYHIKIVRKIKDDKKKIEGFLRNILKDFSVEVKDGHAVIRADIKAGADKNLNDEAKKKLREGIKKKISNEIKKRIPNLKLIEFRPFLLEKESLRVGKEKRPFLLESDPFF